MNMTIDEMVAHMWLNPGASQEVIQAAVAALNRPLPADYLCFMGAANGGEGPVGDGYLMLWPLQELCSVNREYGMCSIAPRLVAFGTDGAAMVYAFDEGRPSTNCASGRICAWQRSSGSYGQNFRTFCTARLCWRLAGAQRPLGIRFNRLHSLKRRRDTAFTYRGTAAGQDQRQRRDHRLRGQPVRGEPGHWRHGHLLLRRAGLPHPGPSPEAAATRPEKREDTPIESCTRRDEGGAAWLRLETPIL